LFLVQGVSFIQAGGLARRILHYECTFENQILCEISSRKGAKARKGAKKTFGNAAALCAFVPLREKSSFAQLAVSR
jgi:hypothetical protein